MFRREDIPLTKEKQIDLLWKIAKHFLRKEGLQNMSYNNFVTKVEELAADISCRSEELELQALLEPMFEELLMEAAPER
ncbi:MAG: hypothetical protein PHP35_01390 [Candidatus Colwellbacteria bacterium]|nr:hypothetical protein [Candidatus Colwellbacteria bacterium]